MIKQAFLKTQWAAVFLMSVIIFLNVPVYLSMIGFSSVAVLLLGTFGSLALVFWWFYGVKGPYPCHYLGGIVAWFLMVVVSHLFMQDEYSLAALQLVLNSVVGVFVITLLWIAALRARFDIKYIFLFGGLLAAAINIVDYFDRGYFFEVMEGFGVRAAGYYVNANKSAEAILLAMILGISVVPAKWRILFCYFCLAGIALTLSRSAIGGWFLVFMLFVIFRLVSYRAAAIGALAAFVLSGFLYAFWDYSSDFVDVKILEDRISFVSGDGWGQAMQDDRVGLASAAYELFAQSPVYGNGVYSILRQGGSQLAHNQYLQLLSDFGIMGIFLYVLILLSLVPWGKSQNKEIYVFMAFVIFWGLFSHNILDSYVFIMAFSYLAVRKVHYKSYGGA